MYYITDDDHTAYAALNLIGKYHMIILHGKEEYVRDDPTHILECSGNMPKHGYIIIEEYLNHTLT